MDSTLTALSGHAGSVRFGSHSGNLNFETGAAWRSPGFELNDVGFLRNTDEINQFSWMGYNIRNPFSVFRRMSFNFNQWLDFEYGGSNLYQAFNFNTNASFRNNWNYNASISRENERISNYELRGGPSIRMPGGFSANGNINTDSRRMLRFGLGGSGDWSDDDSGSSRNVWTNAVWRPNNAILIEVNPSYNRREPDMQYVTTTSFGDDARYIYGHLDQTTFDVSLRCDYALTPNLTVQLYAAPFVSSGSYNRLRRITDSRADQYDERFELFGDTLRYDAGEDAYHVDEDGDGTEDDSFNNRDFNFRDFNSNLVLRWQSMPGSSLYVVWSQARSDFAGDGNFALSDDLDSLFGTHPHNVLLVKASYWFNL